MAEYKVELIKETEYGKKELGKVQYFIFKHAQDKIWFLLNNNPTFKSIKKYLINNDSNHRIFIQKGTLAYLNKQKAKLETFFLGEDKAIKTDNYLKNIVNDGKLKKIANKIKNIPGKQTLAFFNRFGIYITWEVTGNDE